MKVKNGMSPRISFFFNEVIFHLHQYKQNEKGLDISIYIYICTNFNNSYLVYLVAQLGSASLAPRLVK